MSASEVGITRNLLQDRVQFGRGRCDPLQIFLVEHTSRLLHVIRFAEAGHHTHSRTAPTSKPKVARINMNQSRFLPARFMPPMADPVQRSLAEGLSNLKHL